MDIQATLERLSGLQGPSGYEHPVAEAAVELMRPLLDEANVDRFGNAVGVRLCGKPGAPRLLLDAHLDEVGLMVTGIEEGFLRSRTGSSPCSPTRRFSASLPACPPMCSRRVTCGSQSRSRSCGWTSD